jgi:PAS domain S-box-containing protein
MKLIFKYFLIAFSLILIPSSILYPQDFIIHKYSVDNGLPDNRVNDIVQDSLGRIWIATKIGIAMYDGVEWKIFGEKDGAPVIEYLKIKIDPMGVIWFLPSNRYYNFLVFYKNSRWQKLNFTDLDLTASPLISIDVRYDKKKPVICIGTLTAGVVKYENESWKRYSRKDGLLSDSTTKALFKNNDIYVSSVKGLTIINQDNVIKNYNFKKYGIDPYVLSMTYVNENVLQTQKLLLFGKDWLGEFVDEEIKLFSKNFKIPFIGLYDLTVIDVHPSGDILFGNLSKIFSYNFNTKLIRPIIFDNPESNKGANSILVDYEGNIWFAGTRGIYKCEYTPFHNFNKTNGLLENEVSAISEFNSGEMVFGHNYGITIKTGDAFKYVVNSSYNKDARIVRVLDFYHDKKNDVIYYCSLSKGVGKLYPDGNVEWIKSPLVKQYQSIFKGINDKLIVSSDIGLLYLEQNKLFVLAPNVSPMIRRGLFVNDTLNYLASFNSVIRWDNTGFYKIQSDDLEANNFYALFYNDKYGLLVGSIKGLYIVKNNSLVKFSFTKQEINESVYFIIEDNTQNIWIGTNNGVLRWDGKNLKRFNKSDGLAGNETNRAAGFVDSKQNVWIGTDEGVSMYTGEELDYSKIKPKLILLGVENGKNEKFNFSSNLNLNPDENNLTFNYRGLSFIDEARNFYQVKLYEVEGGWNNEFTTNYTYSKFNNLLPGSYIFSARVKNAKGIWSNWVSSSIITIKNPFYQQPLFIIGITIFLLLLIYYVYDYIGQKKYNSKLEQAVESRTKLLNEKQSELITSLERYKGIVDSQTDLVVRVDSENKFTFVNDAYCSVFGKRRNELIGNSFFPLIHPDDRDSTLFEMDKLKVPPHRAKMEQRANTLNGYRWLLWEDYAIFDENGKLKEIQGVGRDITLQKEIEAELEKLVRERTAELKSLVSQSPFGILTFNAEGFLIEYNKEAERLFGNLKEYLFVNKSFNIYKDEFLLKNNYQDKLLNLNTSRGLLITDRILIDDPTNIIYQNLLSRYLIYRIYTVEYEDKSKNLVVLLEDVTELQKTEEQNKLLADEKIRISTFIKTVETERERISKELHDGLGQLLTTAKLKLDIFRLKTNIDKTEIDDALNILLNAGDEIRRIINDLRPYDVDNFGLVSAIELLCDQIRQASGLNIQYSVTNFKNLPDKKRENLTYRIVQEALNNIIKHSKCKSAGVNIVGLDKLLKIEIWDDGFGIDRTLLERNDNGFGISNMKERIKLLGGTIAFSDSSVPGTKITLNIPIEINV